MSFKRNYNSKRKNIPNKLSKRPIISFKSSLSPECLGYIKNLKRKKQANKFINEAIESYYFYNSNPVQYWKQIIEMNYYIIKRILRKVGRENTKTKWNVVEKKQENETFK